MNSNEKRTVWTSYVSRLHGYVFFLWPSEDRKSAVFYLKLKFEENVKMFSKRKTQLCLCKNRKSYVVGDLEKVSLHRLLNIM